MDNKNIDFLYEVGSLKNIQRGWRQHFGVDVANVLEHSYRVIWIALVLARMEKVENEDKVIKMALLHDLAETRTSDLSYVQKVYVKADEERSAEHLFEGTILENMRKEFLIPYEDRESLEAKIVKDADNLEVDIELKELEQRGSKLPDKWRENRRLVRDEKLYTDSAKKLWDDIQKSDPDTWHLKANKWLKIPDAGK